MNNDIFTNINKDKNKCFKIYSSFTLKMLGKYRTEHMLGCFQPTVGFNV